LTSPPPQTTRLSSVSTRNGIEPTEASAPAKTTKSTKTKKPAKQKKAKHSTTKKAEPAAQ